MVQQKSYALALEIDRSLKLSLNNSRFESLATFLDGYQEAKQRVADNMMRGTPGDVLGILESIKKLPLDSGK